MMKQARLGQSLSLVDVALRYGDWLTGGDVESVDQIKPGMGAVIRRGLTKIAVYREESGILHERSAVCPHLGCIVHWNDSEATWDCPCHGSRFDCFGAVLNGPANRDLAEVKKADDSNPGIGHSSPTGRRKESLTR
jgi:Rieske Fe-S protein